MLLFRSLALGLLGACFFLLATRPATIVVRQPAVEVPNVSGIRGLPVQAPTVIDVARDVSPRTLPALIRLAEGEHIVAVDDMAVANDLQAGSLLSERHRDFIDLQVRGTSGGDRRVLVLLH